MRHYGSVARENEDMGDGSAIAMDLTLHAVQLSYDGSVGGCEGEGGAARANLSGAANAVSMTLLMRQAWLQRVDLEKVMY